MRASWKASSAASKSRSWRMSGPSTWPTCSRYRCSMASPVASTQADAMPISRIGRTSIDPVAASGIRAASSMARSRSWQSTR